MLVLVCIIERIDNKSTADANQKNMDHRPGSSTSGAKIKTSEKTHIPDIPNTSLMRAHVSG